MLQEIEQPLYCRKEASGYLKDKFGVSVSTNTLAKYATVGGGPEYLKFGKRVLYASTALDSWVLSKISDPIRSTSQGENREC